MCDLLVKISDDVVSPQQCRDGKVLTPWSFIFRILIRKKVLCALRIMVTEPPF